MKKTIAIYLLALVCFSCASDYEKSMEKTMDCIEDKYDDEVVAYTTVDEALTAFDFESARKLVACYEDVPFHDGYRSPGISNRYNMHWQMMNKIVKAEVTYFMKNGEIDIAKTTAVEADMFMVYNEALPSYINKLIDSGEYDKALSIVAKYTFVYSEDDYMNSDEFKEETNKYNDMVNSLFNDALLREDLGSLRKCLVLYKTGYGDDTKAADEAKRKLKSINFNF